MAYTPMMRQYLEIKKDYKDTILLFRLGDFYEMFFEDALLASKILEIALTGKNAGEKEKVPMCGVPYHAVDTYIARLIKKGYKVAICEQVENPSLTKSIVKREVVKVITPGTVLEGANLEEKSNNYLVAITPDSLGYGFAVADISTGLFQITQFLGNKALDILQDELLFLRPSEILLPNVADLDYEGACLKEELLIDIENRLDTVVTDAEVGLFEGKLTKEKVKKLWERKPEWTDFKNMPLALVSAGALLSYIRITQKKEILELANVQMYGRADFMIIDNNTRKNLEILSSLRDGKVWGSLLWVLDYTKTPMGGRLIKYWLERPLIDLVEIEKRLSAVECLVEDIFTREQLVEGLNVIYDLERLMSKVSFGNANAKDLLLLKHSFAILPSIKEILKPVEDLLLKEANEQLDDLQDIYKEMDSSLNEEPPSSLREGFLIRDGYQDDVDRLRKIAREGKSWLANFEAQERARTGIKSLKVGYNKVFGYYIEITKVYIDNIPSDYIRKQTLVNAERYISPTLKEMEEEILEAEENLIQLEYEIFQEVREKVAMARERVLKTANILAVLDVLISFAKVAIKENYIRPRIDSSETILIKEGRHPVVEKVLGLGQFVANDLEFNEEQKLLLLTGPNMAGKSTFMRQTALLILMAQVGSFIPAKTARIGIVDRIFTRIGACDDLVGGQSTFMVEMKECQVIMTNATEKSLIIMDEVGRGTSTYDGISIAKALVEYIVNNLKARTIFSTHYYELTDLNNLPLVSFLTMLVKEEENKIYFLHKVVLGKADQSYGIHVASLAGLPKEIIEKAKFNMQLLTKDVSEEKEKLNLKKEKEIEVLPNPDSLEDINLREIKEEIISLEVMKLTPLDAFQQILKWQEKIKNG